MSDTRDQLAEVLRAAWFEVAVDRAEPWRDYADALLASDAIAAVRAAAWDEGRRHGAQDMQDYHTAGGNCGPDVWDCECPTPYRADTGADQ